jgi:hypothetical protein
VTVVIVVLCSLLAVTPLFSQAKGCPDPLAVVEKFYASNDAARYGASAALLTPDATLASWSEGVNGHHMLERRISGTERIRPFLGTPGFRHVSGRPDGMIYRETKTVVSRNAVIFMLVPDRQRPNGRPYNPYRVEIVLRGCAIASLTVVELITWL